VHVLMIGAGNPPPTFIQRQVEALKQAGISVTFFPGLQRSRWQSYLAQVGIDSRLPEHLENLVKQADILHFQWLTDWLNHYALAEKYRKMALLSLRGRQVNILPYLPDHQEYRKRIRRLLPRCDAFHAVSRNILEEAQQWGVTAGRSRVIYTAVDTDFFTPPPTPPISTALRITMIGGLIWRKGYEYALLALQQIVTQYTNIELVIVGDGNERDRVEETIRDLKLTDYVYMVGNVAVAAVRDLLQSSHIFLHTSLSEGLANSVVEAMSCGVPVISTNCGGMNEAIEDGAEGLLIPVRDPEATAAAVLKLVADPALRMRMGQTARARALTQFTLSRQAQEFRCFYEQLSR
jgi:colanic acid/amylovoran biosynthesis glycosyltransferase